MTDRRAISALLVVFGLTIAGFGCSSAGDGGSSASTNAREASDADDPAGVADAAGVADPHDLYVAACAEEMEVGPGIDLPDELAEISGIAPSSERSDVVWAVGDGGSAASVFAVDLDGNLVTTVALEGVDNNDWEDLATGPALDGSGATWLYVADIGDNTSERERIRIQAFPEPSLTATTATPRTVLARYATGATDAEALAVTTDGIWILGKEWAGGSAPLFHLGFDAIAAVSGDELAVVEAVGFALDTDGDPVTAMDGSPTAGVTAVRTYGKVRLFPQTTPDLAEVLDTEACEAPPIVEGQGESVAVTSDGRSLVTASEAGAAGPAELHVITIG